MAQRLARVVLAAALASALFAAPAAAGVSNPIPMNGAEEPENGFYDNQPLYAYATTTPSGGQLCVVKPREDIPADGSLSCDDLDAWGDSTKFASGIGSTFVPISAPSLPTGDWMLLADNAPPASDWISDTFSVYPCTLEDQCPDAWGEEAKESFKDAMRVMYVGSQSACHLLRLLAYAPAAIATYEVMSTVAAAWGLGASFALGVGTYFVIDTAGDLDPRLDVDELVTNLVQATACKWAKKSKEIADDPPDPDYGEVAPVAFGPVRLSGDATADGMGTALNRMEGYGDALLTAYERYQGAEADGAGDAMQRQAQAVADTGFALTREMRVGARRIEAFADALAADPDVPDPALTDEVKAAILAMQDRVRTTGFTAEELASLREAGLDDDEIALARQALGEPVSSAPTGVSYKSVLDAMAEDIRDGIDEVAAFSRGAAAAAGRHGARPRIVIREQTAPAGADASFSYSASDPAVQSFSLRDGQDHTSAFGPGTVTISTSGPGGWRVTGVTCDDGSSATPSVPSVGSANVVVNVEAGETVTCTFTHTRDATIVVEAETSPADELGRHFTFEVVGQAIFSLADDDRRELVVPAGEHAVLYRGASGAELDAVACDDGDSTGDVGSATATVRAAPGETVTCTFTSALSTGRIVLDTTSTPRGAQQGVAQVQGPFGPVPALDGIPAEFDVGAGPQTLAVTPAEGAHVASYTCEGGFTVHAGQVVHCALSVVHDDPGRITIENQVDAAVIDPAQEFPFRGPAPLDVFALRPGVQRSFAVWPGTYSVERQLPGNDYTPVGPTCDDDDSHDSQSGAQADVIVAAGEQVRCTFGWTPVAMMSAGPLRRVLTTPELACGVNHVKDRNPEFFFDTACGTFLRAGDATYGPQVAAGPSVAAVTPVSRSTPAGAGTRTDPLRVVTEVVAGDTGLRIRQTDAYVVGEEAYKTTVEVVNESAEPRSGRLYRAADCYLQESDAGLGDLDPDTGAVGCRGVVPTEHGPARGDRIEQWYPLTPGSRAFQAHYAAVWARVAAGDPFDDTCACDAWIDNGAGLQWDYALAPGARATFAHLTTFSPLGRKPLLAGAVVTPSTVVAGGRVDYELSVANDNQTDVGLEAASFTLPPGFAYVPGSTQGASEPAVAGRTLTWASPGVAAAAGRRAIRFGALAALQPGTYDGEAAADPADPFVGVPSGPVARVTVTADAVPPAIDLRTPPEGARYARGAAVTADFSCADTGSGIAACTGTAADGAPVDTAQAGTHAFEVTAVDRTGNRTVVRHTYEVVAPPAPTPTPTATPTPTPTVTPTPTPKPQVHVKGEQVVSLGLPTARRCVSRRRFPIRLRAPKGATLRSARVWVDGKRAKVTRKGGRLTAMVDLRGMRKGRFAVLVRAVTADGRKVRDKRRYRTCAKRRKPG